MRELDLRIMKRVPKDYRSEVIAAYPVFDPDISYDKPAGYCIELENLHKIEVDSLNKIEEAITDYMDEMDAIEMMED